MASLTASGSVVRSHLVLAYTCFDTPWGYFGLAATDRGPCGAILPTGSRRKAERLARRRWPEAGHQPGLLPDLQAKIVAYYAGKRVRFDAALDLDGLTEFRQAVLRACARIAYGVTRTYSELAAEVGSPAASRAVGGAMAHNPIPLIVPCHRVVAVGGRLGGFSAEGGLATKTRMLQLEGIL